MSNPREHCEQEELYIIASTDGEFLYGDNGDNAKSLKDAIKFQTSSAAEHAISNLQLYSDDRERRLIGPDLAFSLCVRKIQVVREYTFV